MRARALALRARLCARLCACSCAASGLAASASAEAPAPASITNNGEAHARELFHEGNELVDQSRYLEALEKYQAAYELWNNPKIKLNMAASLRALGRDAEALEAYEYYLREADPSAERRAEIQVICTELEWRLGRVSSPDAPAAGAGPELGQPARGQPRAPVAAAADVAPHIPATGASTSSPVGVTTRMDIDGSGRGVVGAAGLVFAFDSHWQISAGGLLGKHAGAWAGLELLLLDGPLRPTLGISAPVFFVDVPRVGASADAGLRWAVKQDTLFVTLRAALVHFPEVPQGYLNTLFVPSVGSELRL